jgi:hypothetical protein
VSRDVLTVALFDLGLARLLRSDQLWTFVRACPTRFREATVGGAVFIAAVSACEPAARPEVAFGPAARAVDMLASAPVLQAGSTSWANRHNHVLLLLLLLLLGFLL